MRDFIMLFEELENLKRTRKDQLSKKVHELYSWIADVKKTDCLYLFELDGEEYPHPKYDVYFVKNGQESKFIKANWSPEPIYNPNEVGTYYITYSRLPKLLNVAVRKIEGYIKDSQEMFASEFKLNRILNCIKKKP